MESFIAIKRCALKCASHSIVAGLLALTPPVRALGDEPAPVQLTAKRAIRVSFASRAGERYQIYRSADASTWTNYGEVIVGTGAEIALTYVTEEDARSFFRAETLSGEPIEVVKNIEDFKQYRDWKLVRTLLGPDPFLGEAHGGGAVFRSIYMSPADARLVNGEFPPGTLFLKELRSNDAGTPGAVTDALTVMVKRGGGFNPEGSGWEYFMTDTALTQTLMRGGHETMCFGCHSAARDKDFVFSASVPGP